MKRVHAMPFGAQRAQDGLTRFGVWAPDATSVQLELVHDHGRIALPMDPGAQGWFSTSVADVAAGARYHYRIDDRTSVPDPASRYNPQDVHAASAVVDPYAFDWPDAQWRGRPWEEAVVYELHVGTFTPQGTFGAIIDRLDYLAELGVTAVELMPVADFPGRRGWGYDGVLPFAPEAAYGTPEDLKHLVAAAHERNLMVFLDVVYNHFGPEGNYLPAYASRFFNPRHATPWGAAINLDAEGARTVRDFLIHNALYWLEEFHFDGLRLDAVHAFADDSRPDFLTELCATVRNGPGQGRHVHLILENDRNQARYLERDAGGPTLASGQWNDDFHHAVHVLVTGERGNYYADYQEQPLRHLGRSLAQGFGYQGEASRHRKQARRGEPSGHLPPTAFVNFLQCHDQVGNRAFGERIGHLVSAPALRLAVTCVLPAPSIPMLFMGEEFAANAPFLFFCDFGPDLAQAVREGRQREFAGFGHPEEPGGGIPDANDESTFLACRLDWDETGRPGHREWLELYRELLALRRRYVIPLLAGATTGGQFRVSPAGGLVIEWALGSARLALLANFAQAPWSPEQVPAGAIIHASCADATAARLPPFAGLWLLDPGPA